MISETIAKGMRHLDVKMKSRKKKLMGHNLSQGTEASRLITLIHSLSKEPFIHYLEIGVERGLTFEAINIRNKYGVDPSFLFNTKRIPKGVSLFEMTSDSFFRKAKDLEVDLVYLDGLHTFKQTWRDLCNVAKILTDKALVVIDDVFPSDSISAMSDQYAAYSLRKSLGIKDDGRWHGDVFRVLFALSEHFEDSLHWVTLIELDNPKAVVWKNSNKSWSEIFQPKFLDLTLPQFSYEECFEPLNTQVMHPAQIAELVSLLGMRK